jgi:sugar phosphate isomerase/epimerase
VHFADNTRRYPGTGTMDFAALLRALGETGYTGLLAVECLPWPDGIEAARCAVGYLKKVTAEI